MGVAGRDHCSIVESVSWEDVSIWALRKMW